MIVTAQELTDQLGDRVGPDTMRKALELGELIPLDDGHFEVPTPRCWKPPGCSPTSGWRSIPRSPPSSSRDATARRSPVPSLTCSSTESESRFSRPATGPTAGPKSSARSSSCARSPRRRSSPCFNPRSPKRSSRDSAPSSTASPNQPIRPLGSTRHDAVAARRVPMVATIGTRNRVREVRACSLTASIT